MNQESSPEDKSTKMAQDLFMNLKLNDESKEREPYESKEEFIEAEDAAASEEEDDEDDDTEEEFSFSLVYDEANTSPITADDAFANGQIKPIFPLFNQHLLLKEGMVMEDLIANDRLPNVKKVFIEADSIPATASTSTSTSGNGDVTGSYYYEWENKAVVEVAPDGCKKSNSTGFSKIWRFRDLMHRSSSDGRDAFVFLDNNTASSGTTIISKSKEEPAVVRKAEKKKTVAESTVNGDKANVNPAGEKSKVTKAKKLVKSKTTVASAHEVYLKSKAKEQERRRSYLPYRPGVVGFFTNITGGGLTKNVHPY